MQEKKTSKKDKTAGVKDDKKIKEGDDDDFHERMSSLISSLASEAENGETFGSATTDRPENEKSEIERGVAEVFEKFESVPRSDEKEREIIQAPIDVDIQIDETDTSESEESAIEQDVTELFKKYETTSASDSKQQQRIEPLVNIEIAEPAEKPARKDGPKSSRIIYAAIGIFFILIALIVVKLFEPSGELDKNTPVKSVDAYKIDRPSKKIPTAKIMPLKTENRKSADTDVSAKSVLSDEAAEDSQNASKTAAGRDIMPEITAFLMNWKTAWENTAGGQENMDAYMSFYSDGFKFKGFDRSGWVQEKRQTNRRKQWIRIALTDIQILETFSDGRVRVSFLQDYSSSNFSEKSKKTLILRKEASGWGILGIEDSTEDDNPQRPESSNQPEQISNGQQAYPYTIHVASYRERSVSNTAVDALRKDGFIAFSSYVELPEKGAWYRIFVNYYRTLEEAGQAASKFKHTEAVYANPVEEQYTLQVGIFDSENELKTKESGLRAKGYIPYRVPDAAFKGRTRLCVGAYDSIENAGAEKKNLQNDHFPAIVIKR